MHGGQQGGQSSAAAPPPAAAAPGGPALRQPSRHPPPPALPIPISEPAAPNLAEATCPFARVGACPELNPCMACGFAVADDLRCCCLVHGSALQRSCFIPIQCLLAAAAVPNPAAKTAAAKAADDNFADVLAGTGVDEEAEQAALTAAVSARALGPGAPLPAAALPPLPPLFSQDAFLSQLVRTAKKAARATNAAPVHSASGRSHAGGRLRGSTGGGPHLCARDASWTIRKRPCRRSSGYITLIISGISAAMLLFRQADCAECRKLGRGHLCNSPAGQRGRAVRLGADGGCAAQLHQAGRPWMP